MSDRLRGRRDSIQSIENADVNLKQIDKELAEEDELLNDDEDYDSESDRDAEEKKFMKEKG